MRILRLGAATDTFTPISTASNRVWTITTGPATAPTGFTIPDWLKQLLQDAAAKQATNPPADTTDTGTGTGGVVADATPWYKNTTLWIGVGAVVIVLVIVMSSKGGRRNPGKGDRRQKSGVRRGSEKPNPPDTNKLEKEIAQAMDRPIRISRVFDNWVEFKDSNGNFFSARFTKTGHMKKNSIRKGY